MYQATAQTNAGPGSALKRGKIEAQNFVEDDIKNLVRGAGGRVVPLVAYKLRFVLFLVAIGATSAVLPGPSTQFVKLIFFAAKHGGGSCEVTPTSEACRRAASDAAVYHGVAGACAHSFAWLLALLLGSYSDRVGRRPLLVAAALLSLVSRLSLFAHLQAGVTLWLYLLLEPTLTVFDVYGVFLAVMNDVIKEPTHRVAAFSVLLGILLATGGCAGVMGSALSAQVAVSVSLILGVFQIFYLTTSFPETAPLALQGDEQQLGKGIKSSNMSRNPVQDLSPLTVIRDSLNIIVRSSFISRMTMVLMLSGLASTGFHNTWTPYLTAYFGFNQRTNGQLMMVCGTSIAMSFCLGLRPMLHNFGEYGGMRICLSFKIAFYLLCAVSSTRAQIFLVHACLLGPAFLLIPIIAAIQSNLVGDEEQGRMQGILAACKTIATAVGEIFFGWFYRYATDQGRNPHRSAALPPLMTSVGLALLASLVASSLEPGGCREDADAKLLSKSGLPSVLGNVRL